MIDFVERHLWGREHLLPFLGSEIVQPTAQNEVAHEGATFVLRYVLSERLRIVTRNPWIVVSYFIVVLLINISLKINLWIWIILLLKDILTICYYRWFYLSDFPKLKLLMLQLP